ncbi:ABC transporter permease [Marinobacter bohaiensis]|uniref:ABC transporter permease n=1 Tax=Marinobacter bohaiensis TaxID=2201898 RepID=UPI003898FCFA
MTLSHPDKRPSRVLPVLGLMALILVWSLDLGSIQPNRIVPGTGYGLFSAVGLSGAAVVTLFLLAVVALAILSVRRRSLMLSLGLVLALAALPLLLIRFTGLHLPADAPYARSAIGAGFWALLFLLVLMLIEVLGRRGSGRWSQLAVLGLILGAWGWLFSRPALSSLSLVREFDNRPDQFVQALWAHLGLALGAVAISFVLAFALALKMMRNERWRRPVMSLASFLQTIPSLALFGLLIAPLSALSSALPWLQELGVRGIGWAPALLALIAYSLLPMVRNTYVALTEVPGSVLEAGQGMGMNPRQLFLQVRLPLALPVIVEGVRITTIQAMGLTAVAALVGAGGFGTFIFQGLGQAAMDLVLLGALPTIALALAADAMLSALAAALQARPVPA